MNAQINHRHRNQRCETYLRMNEFKEAGIMGKEDGLSMGGKTFLRVWIARLQIVYNKVE